MDTLDFVNLENKYVVNNYHPLDVVLTRGRGIYVVDVNGKRYMDFLSSYSALNHGHTHKEIIKVIKEQIKKLTLTSRAFRNDQLGLFSKEICELAGYEQVLPMNSGSEAVETALKLARKWGYFKKGIKKDKAEIIIFSNNFHGRTIGIISFSTEDQYKEGFGPFVNGFKIVKFNNTKDFKKAVNKNTAAVLGEIIQGEGGIILSEKDFYKKVAKICKKKNILLMIDEIQTGLGRTGKLFAYQHEGIKPDVLILGKALGGGFYPVSAVLSSKDIFSVISPGDHGSTFGGNPLACAIARKSLQIIMEEKLADNALLMGNYLMDKLRTIKSRWIKEIRGKGLLIGIELTKESGGSRKFCERLGKEGILCNGAHQTVIRLAPPLIINKKEIDFAFKKIKKVLEEYD